MASQKEYLNFILDQLDDPENVSYRPMMGEYLLYYRGKLIGGIYDDRLLLKPTKSALALACDPVMELPYEGAKAMLLADELDNKEFLQDLVRAVYRDLTK